MFMKTTLELPDELMRKLKVRAAESDRRLKDVVAELLELGIEASNGRQEPDRLQRWLAKLEHQDDGTVINPDGCNDPAFFEAVEEIRETNRRRIPRDPFASSH